jgi:glycosyltransferase involved in cell wall biosynthesis
LKTIIVSATALATSGALTILNEFIDYISSLKKYKFIMFVPQGIQFPEADNICYIAVAKKNWISRIYWDGFGLRKFIKKNKLDYIYTISLQNTSINIRGNKIVYLHQSLPFVDLKIPATNISNVKIWLYKQFYSFFIFLFVDNSTSFIVQAKWLKKILSEKHKIKTDKIYVIKPKGGGVFTAEKASGYKDSVSSQKFNIIYPATPIFYKNHVVLIEAFNILKARTDINDLVLNVTFHEGEHKMFDVLVKRYDLRECVHYLGYLTREQLYKKYEQSSLMVFPSYVETCGLPLLEGASMRLPVIASDLPYANEMLEGYDGVVFVKYDDPHEWAKEIEVFLQMKDSKKFEPLNMNGNESDWSKLVTIIEGRNNV